MTETIDLTTARTAVAPYRFNVPGPELRVQSLGAPITVKARGELFTITDPQTVASRDCGPLGDVEVTHAAAPSQTAVLFYSTVLSLGKADRVPAAAAGLTLVELWQGIDSGHNNGRLAAVLDPQGKTMGSGGASTLSLATTYLTEIGGLGARVSLDTPASAWFHCTPVENVRLDVMSGIDPTVPTKFPAAFRKADPRLWRCDVPIHVSAITNTGVVGTGDECRVHAGLVRGNPGYANLTHWPGPGLFFVTKRDTQTWKAVIAASNRDNAHNRQEYWGEDTGVSYLTPHILTVQQGYQLDGTSLVQWAIDGVVVKEYSGRLAALLNAGDFSSLGGAQAYSWVGPGVTATAPLLNDVLTFFFGYGSGISLWTGARFLTRGVL